MHNCACAQVRDALRYMAVITIAHEHRSSMHYDIWHSSQLRMRTGQGYTTMYGSHHNCACAQVRDALRCMAVIIIAHAHRSGMHNDVWQSSQLRMRTGQECTTMYGSHHNSDTHYKLRLSFNYAILSAKMASNKCESHINRLQILK